MVWCSAQRQKVALAEQQVQYQDLLAANRKLQEQNDINLRDNFEVTEFLRREILTKNGKITLLESKMDEVLVLTTQAVLHLTCVTVEAPVWLQVTCDIVDTLSIVSTL